MSKASDSNTPGVSSAFTPQGSTHMAQVEADRIIVRGQDLCRDVLGQQSFTAYFLFLLTGQTPSANLVRAADATMVAIAEHGLVPSVQAARMTHAAAPDALQGAVAAGLLGCGPVILGASETAGLLLARIVEACTSRLPSPQGRVADAQDLLSAIAAEQLQALKAARAPLPGFGHPVHKQGDPRADKLLALADEWGLAGAHVAALRALASQVLPVYGKPFPMNVSAAIPAVLLDAGYPIGALKGIPLLARTGSLVAHLLEEQARPIGFKLAAAADRAMHYDGPLPGPTP
ncbi:MAG: citryl-CoA lyase [Betaproteobacteria bacterium]